MTSSMRDVRFVFMDTNTVHANTAPARATTRRVTSQLIRVSVLGVEVGQETSTTAVCQLVVRVCKLERQPWAKFVPGGWQVILDNQVIATCTSENVTADEPVPWTWFMSGASDFPLQIEHDGAICELTGHVGYVAGNLVAQYRGGVSLWATMSGEVVTGEVSAIDGD